MGEIGSLPSALNGANTVYLADLHSKWAADPQSVDPSFAELFRELDAERAASIAAADRANWGEQYSLLDTSSPGGQSARPGMEFSATDLLASVDDSVRAIQLVRAYRVRGHLEARLDPLGLQVPTSHAELDPTTYGFGPQDRDRPIYLGQMVSSLLPERASATINELLFALRQTYCGPIGVEYMHIQDPAQRLWLQHRLEGDDWRRIFSVAEKKTILNQLTEAEGFESFCQKRFTGTKRFGLEGSEATIPALHAIIEQSVRHGTRSVSVGMAHRGRLNVMANVVQKPFAAIFSEFAGASFKPTDVQGSGDVKYHLGTAATLHVSNEKVRVTLLPNPSHLEAVDPVVVGRVRAIQDAEGCVGQENRFHHLGLLIHGDAAFAGQGIVYETMAMSQLIGYRTGGTIHVVTNNQIGFTTISAHAHSGFYCTDIAKAVQAPILHVNGDEPEASAYCARLAADYRREFAADIVLDLVCYRRHGHNEADEPAFTQPTMYKAIAARPTTRALYAKRLAREKIMDAETADDQFQNFQNHLQQQFEAAKSYQPSREDWLECNQDPSRLSDEPLREQPITGISLSALQRVGAALTRIPEDFALHPRLRRLIQARSTAIETGNGIDWAMGEALAFGSLLLQHHPVRLSGEDCQRGTFSQRHAVLVDQLNQSDYLPLNNIADGQAKIEVYNSLLSEFGVLGFEYGYTLAAPNTLVLWEAQFGDFANGAQVIIDQFIASGETKWLRTSGLVMLLPHGYEGQGPEHSSARLERYLQLCAENNLRVCNITTPGNYFHALRRQIARECRKPLIIMTPKSLLRHKEAVSDIAEFGPETRFCTLISETDDLLSDAEITRVVLCSGKVYYDLRAARRKAERKDVAILRLEQLYPFPRDVLAQQIARYPNARIIWCQEESQNAGAWNFVDRRIEQAAEISNHAQPRPIFAGRKASASPATGLASEHTAEQIALVEEALKLVAS